MPSNITPGPQSRCKCSKEWTKQTESQDSRSLCDETWQCKISNHQMQMLKGAQGGGSAHSKPSFTPCKASPHHNAMPHTVGGHIAFCTGTTLGNTQTKTQRLEPHWNHTNRDLAHCNATHSGTFCTGTTLGDTQTQTTTNTGTTLGNTQTERDLAHCKATKLGTL